MLSSLWVRLQPGSVLSQPYSLSWLDCPDRPYASLPGLQLSAQWSYFGTRQIFGFLPRPVPSRFYSSFPPLPLRFISPLRILRTSSAMCCTALIDLQTIRRRDA